MTLPLRHAAAALFCAGLLAGGQALAQGTPAVQAPAPAQPPAAVPAPPQAAAPAAPAATEASRREARALGEKLGWEPQVRGIINTVRTQIIVSLAQTNGKTPQEMIGAVDDVLMPDFVNEAASLTNVIVEAWAESFTADEMRNLRSFYNTPLGDKLLRSIPVLNNKIAQSGQNWAQRVYQAAQQKHADEFAKRGLKFSSP